MVRQTKPAPGGDPLAKTPFYDPADNPDLKKKNGNKTFLALFAIHLAILIFSIGYGFGSGAIQI